MQFSPDLRTLLPRLRIKMPYMSSGLRIKIEQSVLKICSAKRELSKPALEWYRKSLQGGQQKNTKADKNKKQKKNETNTILFRCVCVFWVRFSLFDIQIFVLYYKAFFKQIHVKTSRIQSKFCQTEPWRPLSSQISFPPSLHPG